MTRFEVKNATTELCKTIPPDELIALYADLTRIKNIKGITNDIQKYIKEYITKKLVIPEQLEG